MGKSVYSLVLSDEVVAAVDILAAREGRSRSAFVNHVLAQAASLQTPEHRNRQTLTLVLEAAGEAGFRTSLSTGGTLTLRTALRYKYNPALSYVVELWNRPDSLGQLRVGVRSQSDGLLAYFGLFLDLWEKLEQKHLPQPPPEGHSATEAKRYVRTLRHPAAPRTEEETGQAIADYIHLMDACMKIFFTNLEDATRAVRETEQSYKRGLARHSGISEL